MRLFATHFANINKSLLPLTNTPAYCPKVKNKLNPKKNFLAFPANVRLIVNEERTSLMQSDIH